MLWTTAPLVGPSVITWILGLTTLGVRLNYFLTRGNAFYVSVDVLEWEFNCFWLDKVFYLKNPHISGTCLKILEVSYEVITGPAPAREHMPA